MANQLKDPDNQDFKDFQPQLETHDDLAGRNDKVMSDEYRPALKAHECVKTCQYL